MVNTEMEALPKISIVTISLNQARFLEKTIRSVIYQDYPYFEYIVVDSGSTDGSRDIVERYRDRIDKIIFEQDEGPADGLNKGFALATGDIYGFINSDDFFLPGAFRTVAVAFSKAPHRDILSGHSLVVDACGTVVNRFYSRRFTALRSVYGAATLAQQSTFFRSTAYKNTNGFNVSNRVAWDGELWIDLALSGVKFGRINAFLSAFRVCPETISGSGRFRDEYALYHQRMFERVRGRTRKSADEVIRLILKSMEYVENPQMLLNRVVRGPTIAAK